MKKILPIIRKHTITIFFTFLGITFSFWLMFSTFSYENGNILVASKAWSDFGSHIPLIRSFSFGFNYPPEYPLFAGEPIHYHFVFYAFVGFLEKLGVPIDFALNAPSAILFFALLAILYYFSLALFKSKAVGILTVLFFLFNGSLSFIYFIKSSPLDLTILQKAISSTNFTSFQPYFGEGLISAFWNLNIYTNQRHLAAAFAFSLFVIYIFLRPVLKNKNSESITISLLLGILLGFSFFFHIAAFGMTAIVIFLLSILFPKLRQSGLIILTLMSLLALPQYKYMNQGASAFSITYSFGYLTPAPINALSFLDYWTQNLGLHLLLIPLGFLLAPKKIKRIFIAFFAFFIIGNVFQFSPEMAANHKFFNYFMLVGGMFSAYAIVLIWKRSFFLKPIAILLTLFLILSGILDFFPIYNDTKVRLSDYPYNPDVLWIMQNTPPDSVFLNTSYFIPVESLPGRKILFGWPYFAWSQGYDTHARGAYVETLLSSSSRESFCKNIGQTEIDYLRTTNPHDTSFPPINPNLLLQLQHVYTNLNSGVTIYDIQKNCK